MCHALEFFRLTYIQGHQRSSKLQIYHYEWYSCPVNYFAYKSSNALQIGFGGSYYISRCVVGPRGYIGLTVSVRLSMECVWGVIRAPTPIFFLNTDRIHLDLGV